MGRLVFGYWSGHERLEILTARVLKKDGTYIEVGPDSIIEVTEPFAGIANQYTDLRQKHIILPGLRPGDAVEYRVKTIHFKPFSPGNFWFSHSFVNDVTCLEEKLKVSLPPAYEIHLKHKPEYPPSIKDESTGKVYEWTHTHQKEDGINDENIEHEPLSDEEIEEAARPDIRMTTFDNWEEVASWYRPLQLERMAPTDALQAKTEDLIRNCKTDLEKIQAIYSFVSTDIRYISLSFGLGKFIPHFADEVLKNLYGDCKDKHTLLAAMLEIAGYDASPVLANVYEDITEDCPSPDRFNHVLTVVHLGGSDVWLDTTVETAPFQVLPAFLRNKKALIIHLHGSAEFSQIPGDAPFPFREEIEIDAELSESGKVTGRVCYRARGDREIQLRNLFRQIPAADWNIIAEQLNSTFDLPGDVRNTTTTDPLNTQIPFQIDYEFSGLLNISQKSDKKQTVAELPLPYFLPPKVSIDNSSDPEPIDLGYPIKRTARLKMNLPENFDVNIPVPVSVKRDYGSFESIYRIDGNVLFAERNLEIRAPEISGSRAREHNSFHQTVKSDSEQYLRPSAAFIERVLNTEEEDADKIHESAYTALENQDYSLALKLFKRTIELEPEHRFAWNNLGRVYRSLGEYEQAIECFKKQIAINPYDEYSYQNLGDACMLLARLSESEQAYRKHLEIDPLDDVVHFSLGRILLMQGRISEAIPEFENTLRIKPDNADTEIWLGMALFLDNQREEAILKFERALKESSGTANLNLIAQMLATSKYRMDLAEKYAKKALNISELLLRNMPIEIVKINPELTGYFVSPWTTLGYIYLEKEDYEKAEKYLLSAWELEQTGQNAYYLSLLYLRRGDMEKAIPQLAISSVGIYPHPDARKLLAGLVEEENIETFKEQAIRDLEKMRMVEVNPGIAEDLEAKFLIVLSSSQPSEAEFVSGDEKLRVYEKHLLNTQFRFRTPDDQPLRLVRRGKLKCSQRDGKCRFIVDVSKAASSLLRAVSNNEIDNVEITSPLGRGIE
ncbi:MAG: tetratricopeptide repeat protein [Acidobacteria bacterium]|nr:tetratricopeptide repeat protein [Acidobacteriota bacterium]